MEMGTCSVFRGTLSPDLSRFKGQEALIIKQPTVLGSLVLLFYRYCSTRLTFNLNNFQYKTERS